MNIYDDVLDLRDLSEDHETTILTLMETACDFPEMSVLVVDEDHMALCAAYWASDAFQEAVNEVGVEDDEIERSVWCLEFEEQLCSIEEAARNEPILIADSHFEDYARELAEEIGAVPNSYEWPASHIDWEAAASALQMDYSEIILGGYTFWTRAW